MATVQYRIQIDESLVIELDEMAQKYDEVQPVINDAMPASMASC